MSKQKSHKGLLKRIRVSAGGKVLFKRPNRSHLRSGKSAKTLMNLRRRMVAKSGDMNRLQLLLGRRLKPAHYKRVWVAKAPAAEAAV
jgi:large subunit ribosomal protein L35